MEQSATMLKEATIEAERKLVLKKLISLERDIFESMVNDCELLKFILRRIRKRKDFLKIFSSEDIHEMNQAERKIPGILRRISDLSDPEDVSAFDFYDDSDREELYCFVRQSIDEIYGLVESKQKKIPRPRGANITLWKTVLQARVVYYWRKFRRVN